MIDSEIDYLSLKPDFMLKRVGLDLWDVLDIKASDSRMIVGRKTRRKFSEAVAEAVAQLREYISRIHQKQDCSVHSCYGAKKCIFNNCSF